MPDKEDLYDFATWVADYIFTENWDLNCYAFAELACRKLNKLGIVQKTDDKWVYLFEDVEA